MAEQQTKTVIEWLTQAKADGYPWAQSAIEQVDEDRYMQCDCLARAVAKFAIWRDTKEGEEYWYNICDELKGDDFFDEPIC